MDAQKRLKLGRLRQNVSNLSKSLKFDDSLITSNSSSESDTIPLIQDWESEDATQGFINQNVVSDDQSSVNYAASSDALPESEHSEIQMTDLNDKANLLWRIGGKYAANLNLKKFCEELMRLQVAHKCSD